MLRKTMPDLAGLRRGLARVSSVLVASSLAGIRNGLMCLGLGLSGNIAPAVMVLLRCCGMASRRVGSCGSQCLACNPLENP